MLGNVMCRTISLDVCLRHRRGPNGTAVIGTVSATSSRLEIQELRDRKTLMRLSGLEARRSSLEIAERLGKSYSKCMLQ